MLKLYQSPYELSAYSPNIREYLTYQKNYNIWLSLLSVFGLLSHLVFGRFSIVYCIGSLVSALAYVKYVKINTASVPIAQSASNDSINSKSKDYDVIKLVKKLAFIPITLLFTITILTIQFFCFSLEISVNEIYNFNLPSLLQTALSLLPTIIIVVATPIITLVYDKFVVVTNHWEGVTSNEVNKTTVDKYSVLNFVISYVPLIITSLIYLPFGSNLSVTDVSWINSHIYNLVGYVNGKSSLVNYAQFQFNSLTSSFLNEKLDLTFGTTFQNNFKINDSRLLNQYQYFIVTNQIIQLVFKLLPIVSYKLKNITPKPFSVVDAYRSSIIQFGYVVMFGSVWSLAPVICLLFNFVFLNIDLYTISFSSKAESYSLGQSVARIQWDRYLYILVWIGSMISPIITALYRNGLTQFSFNDFKIQDFAWFGLIFLLGEHSFFWIDFVFNLFIGVLYPSTTNSQPIASNFETPAAQGNNSSITRNENSSNETINEKPSFKFNISKSASSKTNETELNAKLKELEITKKKILQNKLEIERLNLIKTKSDTIISSNSNGEERLSTIDDNTHFVPPTEEEEEENSADIKDGDDEEFKNGSNDFDTSYEKENSIGSDNLDNSEKESKSAKRRSIKKLFRK